LVGGRGPCVSNYGMKGTICHTWFSWPVLCSFFLLVLGGGVMARDWHLFNHGYGAMQLSFRAGSEEPCDVVMVFPVGDTVIPIPDSYRMCRLLVPTNFVGGWTNPCSVGCYAFDETFPLESYQQPFVYNIVLDTGEAFWFVESKNLDEPLSVAWWSGMGLGGAVVAVMLLLCIGRRGRFAVSRV